MLSVKQAHFLVQQRTQYLDTLGRRVDIRKDNVRKTLDDMYTKDMRNLFDNIDPWLPSEVDSVLDVGCGLGGIDVHLANKYPGAVLWLLDKNGDSGSKIGWHSSAGVFGSYNSLDETVSYLRQKGVKNDIRPITDLPEGLQVGLGVSFLSWGFHYPLETYSFEADTLIVDVRRGYQKSIPPNSKIIHKGKKHDRVLVKNFQCS